VLVATLIALAVSGSADGRPAPSGLPSVLCKEHQVTRGKGNSKIPGVYSYRPHNCLFHKFHIPEPAFQLYAKLRWRRWTDESAFAVGGILGIEVGNGERNVYYEPATVLLQHPAFVCGRLIFTEALITFPEEEFVYHEPLDRLPVPGTNCRGTRRAPLPT
jgi:hypothetical protein